MAQEMMTAKELSEYMKDGKKVLFEGKHGTGKTSVIFEACELLGWKAKYFNAALMDPYIDLVGIPVPHRAEDGQEYMHMLRPKDIDDVDVIIIDELNRGEIKTMNSFLEIIDRGSINGEKLPNLKVVVGAQNPAGQDYDVRPLDHALFDRFDVFWNFDASISVPYFAKKYTRKIANAVNSWYKDRASDADYISPRRMDKLVELYLRNPKKSSLEAGMPPNGTYETGKLFQMLNEACETDEEREARIAKSVIESAEAVTDFTAEEYLNVFQAFHNISTMNRPEIRSALKSITSREFQALTKSPDLWQTDRIAEALLNGINGEKLFNEFSHVVAAIPTTDMKNALDSMSAQKVSNLRAAMFASFKAINPQTADDVRNHEMYDFANECLKYDDGTSLPEEVIDRLSLK